jgi:hypothetical protein
MKMIINTTKHPVIILGKTPAQNKVFPTALYPIHMVIAEDVNLINGIKTVQAIVKSITNVPPKNDDNLYIVSHIVGQYLMSQGYTNIVTPNTRGVDDPTYGVHSLRIPGYVN